MSVSFEEMLFIFYEWLVGDVKIVDIGFWVVYKIKIR